MQVCRTLQRAQAGNQSAIQPARANKDAWAGPPGGTRMSGQLPSVKRAWKGGGKQYDGGNGNTSIADMSQIRGWGGCRWKWHTQSEKCGDSASEVDAYTTTGNSKRIVTQIASSNNGAAAHKVRFQYQRPMLRSIKGVIRLAESHAMDLDRKAKFPFRPGMMPPDADSAERERNPNVI